MSGPFGSATGASPTVTVPLGEHTITLTVDDGNGRQGSGTVTVTVEDTTPPTITAPADIVVADCTGTVDRLGAPVVADQTPPVIETLTAMPAILWPANHKIVPIAIDVSATDNCGTVSVALSAITMNEGDETDTFDPAYDTTLGDGHTSDDIQVDTAGNLSLRAERSGKGTDRVYTITYTATDETGDSASASMTVTVPHDQP